MSGHLTARRLADKEIEKIIATKLRWILSSSKPIKIILFGSAATGEMTTASDIDLIVIFSTVEEMNSSKQRLFQSRPNDDWPHDLLLFDSDSFNESVKKGGGACWAASQDGKVIFQGS